MTDPDPRPLPWQTATLTAIRPITQRVKSYRFQVGFDRPVLAGQHVDVRLTAPDGYQAQRSYSIASAPAGDGTIELMIEGLPDGEVSGFFDAVAEIGDTIELRGPIGGAFVWRPEDGGPLLLAGGGSGVVPLLAMLRHRAAAAPGVPALLLYSVREASEVIAAEELAVRARDEPHFQLMLNLTRAGGRRVDAAMIAEALERLGPPRHAYLCGGNPFVGAVADLLLDAGLDPARVHTERFGG
ncbi:FAD-binding oxidoreductase [Methylobacterium goesingense]|uniref:Ferredoxin-NADP reductase n=1 Tax=Methylobacterium goesingense TaxID=243690 RepID=A0ABV2L5K5_9HYPH|nr:FAD-binding oxidoreductase [Methylobacterium goesingense]GJD72403.1 Propane 2-monooxygenase, reductase component [Methylobacterium goesingense]